MTKHQTALHKQHGKGEFGVSSDIIKLDSIFEDAYGKKLNFEQAKQSVMNGEDVITSDGRVIENRTQLKEFVGDIGTSDQPVMWFTKDTPSSFPIYQWAAATGLSANIISQFLQLKDGDKRKDFMLKKYPKLKEVS